MIVFMSKHLLASSYLESLVVGLSYALISMTGILPRLTSFYIFAGHHQKPSFGIFTNEKGHIHFNPDDHVLLHVGGHMWVRCFWR